MLASASLGLTSENDLVILSGHTFGNLPWVIMETQWTLHRDDLTIWMTGGMGPEVVSNAHIPTLVSLRNSTSDVDHIRIATNGRIVQELWKNINTAPAIKDDLIGEIDYKGVEVARDQARVTESKCIVDEHTTNVSKPLLV